MRKPKNRLPPNVTGIIRDGCSYALSQWIHFFILIPHFCVPETDYFQATELKILIKGILTATRIFHQYSKIPSIKFKLWCKNSGYPEVKTKCSEIYNVRKINEKSWNFKNIIIKSLEVVFQIKSHDLDVGRRKSH